EKRESITILFEEKGNLIPQGLKEKDAVLDGIQNPVDLQTFPLRTRRYIYQKNVGAGKSVAKRTRAFTTHTTCTAKGCGPPMNLVIF
ncbi:MAG: hypothetical protein GY754_47395, partial [bacterium]|nr:hypothetical protein [bacterium]